MEPNQQFSLRWNNYLHHITDAFDSLREDESLVDVTLCCEGRKIKAHKMLLSACSSYFRDIFKDNPCQHPVIVFHNVRYDDLVALISFMYKGEVNVEQEGLSSFLNTAELLEVQGLTSGPGRIDETDEDNSQEPVNHYQSCSPKSYPRPESPAVKRRKMPVLEELTPRESGSPSAPIKFEEPYAGDSHDESEDHKHPSLSQTSQNDRHYDNSYSDENIDASSDMVGPSGSSNDVPNLHDSLQVPATPVFTCPECGKTFKHSGSLSMHKRLHIGDTYCTFCGRVFSRKYYLKLHMKMHHYQQAPPIPNAVPKTE